MKDSTKQKIEAVFEQHAQQIAWEIRKLLSDAVAEQIAEALSALAVPEAPKHVKTKMKKTASKTQYTTRGHAADDLVRYVRLNGPTRFNTFCKKQPHTNRKTLWSRVTGAVRKGLLRRDGDLYSLPEKE